MIGDTAELAAPISKLRDDLLSEVLLRLPNPKSACRCKPVCKRWRSLISTAYFTRRFLSTSTAAAADDDSDEEEGSLPDHEHLIGSNAVPKPILTFLPLLPDRIRDGIRVLDCFKDWLLCGFVEKFDTESFCSSNCFLICNPFTKQWIALPLTPRRSAFAGLVSRLACQPCDDDPHFDEYRFRVVCIYEWGKNSTTVDVFCSESGEWTKGDDPVLGRVLGGPKKVVSWNGELLFWSRPKKNVTTTTTSDSPITLVRVNPFCGRHRDNLHLTTSVAPPAAAAGRGATGGGGYDDDLWDISVSRGRLHVIRLERETTDHDDDSRNALTVWRLEEDGRSWRKLYEVLLLLWPDDVVYFRVYSALKLHPRKPGIVFLERCHDWPGHLVNSTIYSCDRRTGKLEVFTEITKRTCNWNVFQPYLVENSFPTAIAKYRELRSMYDGSIDCLVQS